MVEMKKKSLFVYQSIKQTFLLLPPVARTVTAHLICLFLSDTDYLKFLFPQFVKSNLFHLCYTAVGQMISICNYWNGEKIRIKVTNSVFEVP